MEAAAGKARSNLVLALDLPPNTPEKLFANAKNLLETVQPHICAVKFNRHLILPLGLFDGVQQLLKQAQNYGLPTIMDCKINDIGNTNRIIAEHYFQAGFDAVIANFFVGWEEGLHPVFETADQMNRGIILLVYMSHKGAWEGYGQKVYDPQTDKLATYITVKLCDGNGMMLKARAEMYANIVDGIGPIIDAQIAEFAERYGEEVIKFAHNNVVEDDLTDIKPRLMVDSREINRKLLQKAFPSKP